jgi:hypothetical protein
VNRHKVDLAKTIISEIKLPALDPIGLFLFNQTSGLLLIEQLTRDPLIDLINSSHNSRLEKLWEILGRTITIIALLVIPVENIVAGGIKGASAGAKVLAESAVKVGPKLTALSGKATTEVAVGKVIKHSLPDGKTAELFFRLIREDGLTRFEQIKKSGIINTEEDLITLIYKTIENGDLVNNSSGLVYRMTASTEYYLEVAIGNNGYIVTAIVVRK